MNKSDYKKLIEEYPEHEKDIKNTFGYQAADLKERLTDFYCEFCKEAGMHRFYLALRETFSFKGKAKRYLQICFNPKYWRKSKNGDNYFNNFS